MAEVLDCSLEVSEFKLQSHYHIYFWMNTLEKNKNPLIMLVK